MIGSSIGRSYDPRNNVQEARQVQCSSGFLPAVLDLLHLFLEVLLLRVVEAEWIVAGLAKSKISRFLVTADDSLDTSELDTEDDQ